MKEDYLQQLIMAIYDAQMSMSEYIVSHSFQIDPPFIRKLTDEEIKNIWQADGCVSASIILHRHTRDIIESIRANTETISTETTDSPTQTSIVVYEPKYVITVS